MKNLQELQLKKQEIKSRLNANKDSGPISTVKTVASALSAPPVKNALSLLGIGGSKKEKDQGLVYDVTKTLVTLGMSFMVSQLKLKGITKFVATTAVGLATPYVMDYLNKKFNLSNNSQKSLPNRS